MTTLDSDIAVRFHAGDLTAFEQIVHQFQQRMFRLGWRLMGRREAALDFAQDAFLHAWEKRAMYDPKRPFDFWFYRLAMNLGRDRLRRQRREVLADVPEASVEPVADKELHAREQEARVRTALDRVREPYRECLALRYHGEMSLEEIGRVLGLSLGTVKSRLHRGLKAFQTEYEILKG